MKITNQIKIGQKLVAGFEGYTLPAEFKRKVAEHKIGNVILFANNVQNEAQLTALCGEIRDCILAETGYIPFITIDQEGGCVSRLNENFAQVPGAMQLANAGDKEKVYLAGKITAGELRRCGVNFDLAPVADTNSNAQNPVIGLRSYGDKPEIVADYALEMQKGLLDGGVLCCAKHFPGHGDTAVDSHIGLPVVDKSREELQACEFVPFQKLIDEGIPGIMTTHILFPQLEPSGLPATMSKSILQDLLRGEMGFQGLILTDCMMMGAIKDNFGTVEGGLKAFSAGVDLIFTSHSIDLASEIASRVALALQEGRYTQAELDESFERIVAYKVALEEKPYAEIAGARALAEGLYRESLVALHKPVVLKNPLCLGCHPFVTTLASSPQNKAMSFAKSLAEALQGVAVENSIDPTDEEIKALLEQAEAYDSILFASYNGHVKKGQMRLGKALAALGKPMVWVALRNPYDLAELPEEVYGICAFEYSGRALQAVADVLQGRLVPLDTLNIRL